MFLLSFIVITSVAYYLQTTRRTKHIKVHYHFIREKVLAKEIDLIHISTKNQVVDIFTKALGTNKLRKFRKMLGILKVDLSLKESVENSNSTN